MDKHSENCMICGEQIVCSAEQKEMNCSLCSEEFSTNTACAGGHFVCDSCHAQGGFAVITKYVSETASCSPAETASEIMRSPAVNMHGPEHHYLTAAVLLAAYKNAGGKTDFKNDLNNLRQRAEKVPGGICGLWGSCGAGIASGIFISIITGADPFSSKEWSLANKMTSESLAAISENGGPRCCKRCTYISLLAAAEFVKRHFGIIMDVSRKIECEFSHRNNECRLSECLFFAGSEK